jgi:hypothetical protein
MNSANPTPTPANPEGFDSLECGILIVDKEPGTDVVRPPSPEVLKWATAERERLRKIGFNLDGTPLNPPPDADAK